MSTDVTPSVREHDDFLGDARGEIQRLRDSWRELESGDARAWARARTIAHNLAARALGAEFGVLRACALELERLLVEHREGAALDAFHLRCVDSAIEMLSLEVAALRCGG